MYRKETTATATDVTTGRCISAFGQRAGSVVDALSVTITAPTGGECKVIATGPGPGGFGGGHAGAPGGTTDG